MVYCSKHNKLCSEDHNLKSNLRFHAFNIIAKQLFPDTFQKYKIAASVVPGGGTRFTRKYWLEVGGTEQQIEQIKTFDRLEDELTKEEQQIDIELVKFENNPSAITIVKALREVKTRIGQQRFRNRVLKEDGELCVFTNDDVVTAAHLNLPGHQYSKHGLTMRADLEIYFDRHDTQCLQVHEGEIFFNRPGHPVHGLIARLSSEKKAAVIEELRQLRP